jgi:hypothetical protein
MIKKIALMKKIAPIKKNRNDLGRHQIFFFKIVTLETGDMHFGPIRGRWLRHPVKFYFKPAMGSCFKVVRKRS